VGVVHGRISGVRRDHERFHQRRFLSIHCLDKAMREEEIGDEG
jgi:hypothetical protein